MPQVDDLSVAKSLLDGVLQQIERSGDAESLARSGAIEKLWKDCEAAQAKLRQVGGPDAAFFSAQTHFCRGILQMSRTYKQGLSANMTQNVLFVGKAMRLAEVQTGHKKALNEFEQSLKLDPDNPMTLLYVGQCYEVLDKKAQAKQTYARVQELDPKGHWGMEAAKNLARLSTGCLNVILLSVFGGGLIALLDRILC